MGKFSLRVSEQRQQRGLPVCQEAGCAQALAVAVMTEGWPQMGAELGSEAAGSPGLLPGL